MTNAKEKVGEQCSISGLGVITLSGAIAGQRAVGAVYSDGQTGIPVSAEEMDADGLRGSPIAWELVSCTFNASANTLTRNTVTASSNAGAPVNFGAGLKRAFVYLPVADVGGASTGAVRYDVAQSLTGIQQYQALENAGAASQYNLSAESAERVQADLDIRDSLGTASALNVAASGNASSTQVVKGNDTRLSGGSGGSGMAIGSAITGATANKVLHADASNNLAQANITFGRSDTDMYVPILANKASALLGGMTVQSFSTSDAFVAANVIYNGGSGGFIRVAYGSGSIVRLSRLARMAEFTRALQTPTGFVPQIGDNDSGRFFHLTPMYQKLTVAEARSRYVHLRRYEGHPDNAPYWDSDDQDHSHLLHAAAGLLSADTPETLEGAVISSLARGTTCQPIATPATPPWQLSSTREPQGTAVRVCRFEIGRSPVTRHAFPDFGIYLLSNREFSLSVRCGGSRGTHAHHDHLSIELHHQGQPIFRDPGTFAYTPHPALRRRYRSFAAHAVPYRGEEDVTAPVFQANEAGTSECLSFGADSFLGFGTYGNNRQAYRHVQIQNGILTITDFLNHAGGLDSPETLPYSPGYGKLSSEWISGGRIQTEEIAECVY